MFLGAFKGKKYLACHTFRNEKSSLSGLLKILPDGIEVGINTCFEFYIF